MNPDSQRFDGQAAFSKALLALTEQALNESHREMLWVAPAFDEWPLSDPALFDALSLWLKLPQRRLVLLASRFDGLDRSQPRLAQWRRWRAHVVLCFQAPEEDAASLPSLVWSGGLQATSAQSMLQVLHAPTWRGTWLLDTSESWRWREGVDVVLQRSEPAWPLTTLGL